jgi:hypothetical protein
MDGHSLKSNEALVKRHPLQNDSESVEIQCNSEEHPWQNGSKSFEIPWDPKGCPWQNGRKAIGVQGIQWEMPLANV